MTVYFLTQFTRLAMIAALILCLHAPAIVYAVEPGLAPKAHTVTWRLPELAGAEQIRLEGYRPTTTLTLPLPAGWRVAQSNLQLQYHVSASVAQANAQLIVRLNDQIIFTNIVTTEIGLLRVNLPDNELRAGANQIEITAQLKLRSDPRCLRPADPERWILFGPNSDVEMTLTPANTPYSLDTFPAPFEVGGGLAKHLTFVLPSKPTNQELSALSLIASAIARGTRSALPWQVLSDTEFREDDPAGPVVLIGAADRNRHIAAFSQAANRAGSWLSLARLPWSGDYPVLMVGGSDEQMILQAATALADPTAVRLLNGPAGRAPRVPPIALPSPEDTFGLSEAGHQDAVVRGSGLQALSYTFDRPFEWTPQDGQLELLFEHSKSLQPASSYLEVFLNNQLAAHIQLDAPDSAPHSLSLPLARRMFQPGRNVLRFIFNLESERCGIDAPEGYWGRLGPETRLRLPHGSSGGSIDLGNFPGQLAAPADMSALGIVLPAQSTFADYSDALELVRLLSASAGAAAPRWFQAGTLDDRARQLHLIVLGTPARQPFLAEVNPYTDALFDLSTGTLSAAASLPLPSSTPDLGIVQEIRSPWAANRIILLVAGNSTRGYRQARRVLTTSQLRAQLSGQLAVMRTGANDTTYIYTKTVADLGAIAGVRDVDYALRRAVGPASPWPIILLPSLALAVLALVAVTMLRWYRRQAARSAGR